MLDVTQSPATTPTKRSCYQISYVSALSLLLVGQSLVNCPWCLCEILEEINAEVRQSICIQIDVLNYVQIKAVILWNVLRSVFSFLGCLDIISEVGLLI